MKVFSSLYRWPAEWEQQDATWLAWPHNQETWPGRFENIPAAFEAFAIELSQHQAVNVLTGPNGLQPSAKERLGDVENIALRDVATNDCWIRDYGPTFVRRKDNGSLIGVDWHYNAWGGKYPPYDCDARVAQTICQILGTPFNQSPLYCEGGALDGNGEGLLMTTTSCLLSPNRNPGWSRGMVERELKMQLGVEKVLWVDGGGLQGDDTDGHIDQLARFVSSDVVVAACSSLKDDPNFVGLEQNIKRIESCTDVQDNPLQVHRLPTPPPRFVGEQRVPESYCNFLFVNGGVIVPTFRHAQTDEQAIELLGQLIPERKIIPLDAYELAWGLGAFHCASQQQPSTR